MAKVYFNYSAMNAGKSTALLQANHNYRESGKHTILFTAEVDDRYETGKITSRLGIDADASTFNAETNLFNNALVEHEDKEVSCVLVDEAQFLKKEQILQLCRIADELGIPVLCYGLRTDYQGNPFEGSTYLLAWADELKNHKAVCSDGDCKSNASMNLRLDADGKPVKEGEQIAIGGNEQYKAVCRKHYMQAMGKY